MDRAYTLRITLQFYISSSADIARSTYDRMIHHLYSGFRSGKGDLMMWWVVCKIQQLLVDEEQEPGREGNMFSDDRQDNIVAVGGIVNLLVAGLSR